MAPRTILAACSLIWFCGVAIGQCTPKPHPHGKICGTRGDFPAPSRSNRGKQVLSDPQYVSAHTCQQWCAARTAGIAKDQYGYAQPGCASFAYNETQGSCVLYKAGVGSLKHWHRDARSSRRWYDIGCYNCKPNACPDVGSGSLLDNGDWGLSNTYKGPWSDFTLKEGVGAPHDQATGEGTLVSYGHGSSNAYLCTHKIGTYCKPVQAVNVCPGQLYVISLDIKMPDTPGGSSELNYVTVDGLDLDLFEMHPYNGQVGTGGWVTVHFLTQPSVKRGGLAIALSPTGYSITKIRYTPAHSGGHATHGPNLVRNPGFESGSLAPWTPRHEPSKLKIVSPGISGKYAARFSSKSGLNQVVTLAPFKTYLWTVQYKQGAHNGKNCFLDFTVQSATLNALWHAPYNSEGSQKTITWKRFFTNFSPKGNTKSATLGMTWETGASSCSFTVDNVSLYEVAI